MELLKASGKVVAEDGRVMPNLTVEKMAEGVRIARENQIDLLLAVGGGSCCDYAKAVSVSVHCEEDPWEKYYIRFEEPSCEIVPVGCVLTMVGTGSEMNGGAVITNHEQKLKIGHVFGDNVMPKFAILNPKYTYTLPKRQMIAGIYDIFNHICEQYFSGEDDNTSDYISEALMKSVIHSSRIALQNPEDYEARSNIMWTATWALNTLIAKGKSTDWMVHMLGQSVGAYTDATHGMTLSAVSLPYYRYISSVPVAMMVHPANLLFVQYVGDGESVLFVFLVHARYGRTEYEVRLRGLDPDSLYTYESGDRQKERSGQFLMKRGIRIQLRGDYDSRMIVFRQKKNS